MAMMHFAAKLAKFRILVNTAAHGVDVNVGFSLVPLAQPPGYPQGKQHFGMYCNQFRSVPCQKSLGSLCVARRLYSAKLVSEVFGGFEERETSLLTIIGRRLCATVTPHKACRSPPTSVLLQPRFSATLTWSRKSHGL